MTQVLERTELLPTRAASGARSGGRVRRTVTSGTGLVFLTAFVLYLVAAWNLAIVHHAIWGDAVARVANAFYIYGSRDPHLGAVGFVWTPLPSFAALPFVWASALWAPLRTQAFAGNVVSAGFMAGACATVWLILRELGVNRIAAVTLTALFAAHPLVLMYGSNGESEAELLFFLAMTCFGILRWLDRRDLSSLMVTGAGLALGYLCRQEFLATAVGTMVLVLVVTYVDTAGARRHRCWTALTETTLVALPLLFAMVCWLGSAYMLVGTATSGNDANVEQVHVAQPVIDQVVGGTTGAARLAYALGQCLLLEPFWSALVLGAFVIALLRRDRRIAAPLVTFGGVLVAQMLLFGAGSTYGWLRYAITVVPLAVIAAGMLVAPRTDAAPPLRPPGWTRSLSAVLVIAAVAAGLPSAARSMTAARWGREEAAMVRLLPGYGWAARSRASYVRPNWLDPFDDVAADFDRRHLRTGSVLIDTQYTFALPLKSSRPTQFVVPSDYDFERSLADPATYRVRYLLVSDGPADLIAASYPELRTQYRNGIARLVRTFRAGPNRLRLFVVTRSVTGDRVGSTRG